jgi:hypothetical protein
MLSRVRFVAVLIASLVFAAPALAQEPQPGATVGQGQVITDIATEVEPPPGEDDGTDIPPAVDDGTPAPEPQPDATGRRGEIHVLDSATSSSPATSSRPASASPATTPSPAAVTPEPAAPRGATAKTLPFTGVDAAPLALIGLALVAAGSGLLAVLRQPVK